MKTVAIIMATYNGAEFLRQQLESIRAQTHKAFKVFVRDDGSTDLTLDILREYSESTGWLTILSDDLGPSRLPGLNFFRALKSIDLDSYDYVAFCDQDDVWMPDKIETALCRMEESGSGGYSSNLLAFDDQKSLAWYLRKDFPETAFDYMFQGGSAGCTYVIDRAAAKLVVEQVWERNVQLPAQFSHDWIIYAVCRSHGVKWCHDSAAKIMYRQHAVNSFSALPGVGGLLERLKLARSGWYRKNVLLVGAMLAKTAEESALLKKIERAALSDRLELASQSRKFRRRGRDAFFLAAIIMLGFF
jgi:rhamnosyltransferase